MINDVLGNIGFNWHVAILNFFNFLVILFILNKFFFRKIGHTIHKRDAYIREGVENAKNAKAKIEQAENDAADIVHSSRVDGQKIMDESADRAESIARDIKLKAEHEAESLRDKLKKAIAVSDDKAMSNLADVTPELLKKVFSQIIGEQMTAEVNAKYIKSILTSPDISLR